ncbi:MAG: chemotaxis protein CheW [Gammaproteobacteria bacterium]|nr:chemotaxis protein CheW [Gammaproteobacteria bacterium]
MNYAKEQNPTGERSEKDASNSEVRDYLKHLLQEPLAADAIEGQNTPAQPNRQQFRSVESLSNIPQWALGPFQITQFVIGELSMALPVRDMFALVDLDRTVLQLRGETPDWWIGSIMIGERSVPVLDTYHLVLPRPYRSANVAFPLERLTKVIVTANGKFGIGVDSISQVKTLKSSEVAWRGGQGRRPWLLGTVRQQLCAILDVGELEKLLVQHNIVV